MGLVFDDDTPPSGQTTTTTVQADFRRRGGGSAPSGSGLAEGPARMNFKLNRMTSYSSADLVDELRRVASELSVSTLKKRQFDKVSRVHSSTIIRRFGGWKEALEAAGLGNLYGGNSVTEKMRVQRGRMLDDNELLAELHHVAEACGRNDVTVEDIRKHSQVGEVIFRRRFGTLRHALELAGLEVRALGRRYTDEECFENLYEVWKHYGRQPSFREINSPPSKVGGEAYRKRFGKWSLVLKAFVDRVNQDGEPESVEKPVSPAAASIIGAPREDSRKIPMGLRMQVLHRDRFKCVLCGDNPAHNPICVLHVDHVLPWSKGGKTKEENLRTLCATCNIGRGNRYSD